MPSPFPGMDPYLEGDLWTTLHFSLAAEIQRQLAPKVCPRYLVFPIERSVIDTDGPFSTTTVLSEPVPHVSIEIRDAARRRLVTAIEILSPTNKRGDGRDEYLARRQRLLRGTAHLLEIDLLRQGNRVPMQRELPDQPYFIFLSRAEARPLTEVWPIALSEGLPTVPVPLLAGDPDVPLDLQDAFAEVYDTVHYERAIDYNQPPEVTLAEREARWAAETLGL